MGGLRSFKMFGVMSLLAGLLQVVAWGVYAFGNGDGSYGTANFYVAAFSDHIGTTLFVFAIIGFYLYHSGGGWFKAFSFVTAIIGTCFFLGMKWVHLFVEPVVHKELPQLLEGPPPSPLAEGFTISFLLFTLGVVLIAIMIIMGKRLPLWGGIILGLGPLLDFVPMGDFYPGQLLFGLGLLYLGTKLYNKKVDS